MMMFLHSTNYIHAVVIRYTDDEWSGNILFLFKLGIFYEAPADRGGVGEEASSQRNIYLNILHS